MTSSFGSPPSQRPLFRPMHASWADCKGNRSLAACGRSRRPAHDEDAHEEDHGEEDPHEEAVHDLGHLLPLGPLGARGPLLTEAVGDVLHVAHQLGLHPGDAVAMATEHAGAEGHHGGAQEQGREGLVVLEAAGGLRLVSAAELAAGVLVAGQGVLSLLPGDVVVLGLHSGEVLGPGRLGSGVGPGVFPILMAPMVRRGGVGARAVTRVGVVWLGVGGGGAVLANLIDEEDLGHVVDDEDLGPLGDGLGLGAAEVDVHNEDGEGGGGGDHGHGGDVVFTWGAQGEDWTQWWNMCCVLNGFWVFNQKGSWNI